MTDATLRLALLGFPVTHSLSPALFAYFAELAHISISYELISRSIPYEEGEQALSSTLHWAFNELRLHALNITAPYKLRVGALCQANPRYPRPTSTEAVNLVWQQDNVWYATNTDFAGASYLVNFARINSYQLPVLLIGAGGAAIPILEALYTREIDTICCNRTNQKAKDLAKKYSAKYLPFEDLPTLRDPIILFSALPHHVPFPPVPADIIRAAIDVSYADSALRRLTQARGIPYVSGYPWLFAQGVANYRILTQDTTTPLPYCSLEALLVKQPKS